MKIIVAGSRGFQDYPRLRKTLDRLLSNPQKKFSIVSGGARGADQMGERYARERGLEVHSFPAQWEKYGKSAGYKRNVQMAEFADGLVAFRVNNSRGTTHIINIMREKGKPTRVIEIPAR